MDDLIRDHSLSECCEPVRTLRVVGFKVADSSPSPTSVLTSRESPSTRSIDSPRSKLAEALRTETFHPLPRLRLKSTPRPQVPGFRKSLSHADLHHRELGLASERSEPATPGSRTSASSTPMKIPSTMSRVHTCPIELSEFAGATFKAAIQLPGTLPSRVTITASAAAHSRRHSELSSSSCRSIEEGDDYENELQDSLARDLFQAATLVAAQEEENSCSTSEGNSAVDTAAAVVELNMLQVAEPSTSAAAPPPTKLKLRLPAAAVHRRVRSLEAMQSRPS